MSSQKLTNRLEESVKDIIQQLLNTYLVKTVFMFGEQNNHEGAEGAIFTKKPVFK